MQSQIRVPNAANQLDYFNKAIKTIYNDGSFIFQQVSVGK